MELGGVVTIKCEKTGYWAELEFKLKVSTTPLTFPVWPTNFSASHSQWYFSFEIYFSFSFYKVFGQSLFLYYVSIIMTVKDKFILTYDWYEYWLGYWAAYVCSLKQKSSVLKNTWVQF